MTPKRSGIDLSIFSQLAGKDILMLKYEKLTSLLGKINFLLTVTYDILTRIFWNKIRR